MNSIQFTAILMAATILAGSVETASAHDDAPNSSIYRCPVGYLMLAIPPNNLVCGKPFNPPITRRCSGGTQLKGTLIGRGRAYCFGTTTFSRVCPQLYRENGTILPLEQQTHGLDFCVEAGTKVTRTSQRYNVVCPGLNGNPHIHVTRNQSGRDLCEYLWFSRPSSY
jgi:hypothetical protein